MSKKNRTNDRASRAAAALEEQQRQEKRRRNLMVAGVVGAILVIVAIGFLISRSLDTSADVTADSASSSSTYGVTIGPDSAPNNVVIYEDFLCPYCAQLEKATRDDLAKLAADGKVQVEYRPFNWLTQAGDYSERSAGAFSIVLDKSGPDVAKKFHDLLFENQPSESGPFPDDDELVKLAVEAGADESDVRGPIENGDGADWVAAATKAAVATGLQGTPTVLLNGEVFQSGTTIDDLANDLIAKLQ
jgi:protein-disulfide isomerase